MEYVLAVVLVLICSLLFVPSHDTKSFNGGLVQGGWVQFAVAAIGAFAQAREQRSAARRGQGYSLEQLREEGAENRRTSAFEAALQDFYQQQGNERARKSLANFSRFSSAPQGGEPYYSPEVPEMPDLTEYNYKPPVKGAPPTTPRAPIGRN